MKRIFWLIKSELKLLKKTVAIMTVILTVFTAAFFSVLSVRADLSSNFFENLDKVSGLVFTVADARLDDITGYADSGSTVYAAHSGLTGSTEIKNRNGDIFETDRTINEGGNIFIESYGGRILLFNAKINDLLTTCSGALLSGTWLSGESQISLAQYIADALGVSSGDKVYISGREYTVSGIYDYEALRDGCPELAAHYLISVENDKTLDSISVALPRSSSTYTLYKRLLSMGFNAELPFFYISYLNNISTMDAFLWAVAAMLFVVILVILYSLFSMFFMQRRNYICQLKLLGGTDGTIMRVYCGITFLVILLASVLAAVLANWFNFFMMSLCTELFGIEFAPGVNFLVPLVFIGISFGITFLLYIIVNRQTKSSVIAQMIRKE